MGSFLVSTTLELSITIVKCNKIDHSSLKPMVNLIKHFTIVNYHSTVVITSKLLIFTTRKYY